MRFNLSGKGILLFYADKDPLNMRALGAELAKRGAVCYGVTDYIQGNTLVNRCPPFDLFVIDALPSDEARASFYYLVIKNHTFPPIIVLSEHPNRDSVELIEETLAISAGVCFEEDNTSDEIDEKAEVLFKTKSEILEPGPTIIVTDTRSEILKYFARHPEKLHSMNPRDFEELVCDILRHIGFDAETTKTTRDGGVDIYAHLRNQVCETMMIVECKRYACDQGVGIDVVQRMCGVQMEQKANKALIVTTSFFTEPAKKVAREYSNLMELKDYNDLRSWLKSFE